MGSLAQQLRNAGLPAVYSTADDDDPICKVALKARNGVTWFLAEYSDVTSDGIRHIAYGTVRSAHKTREGFFAIDELEPYVTIVRDFRPQRMSQLHMEFDTDTLTI